MFSLDYWWIVSQCNTHRYVWKYILYSYMKGFGQVRFNSDDIWQRVNFDAQRASEQTGKLSGGPRVFDPRVRQIFRVSDAPTTSEWSTSLLHTKVWLILEFWQHQRKTKHNKTICIFYCMYSKPLLFTDMQCDLMKAVHQLYHGQHILSAEKGRILEFFTRLVMDPHKKELQK